jgi:cytosine/adenosine deaminase-related metal-dependent hydrolase
MFEESRFAFFKSREALGARASRPQANTTNKGMRARRPRSQVNLDANTWLRALANNQRLASEAFATNLSALSVGSMADLIVLDYNSPTPLTSENLAWHIAFGMTSASVESVMVNGRFVIRDRRSVLEEQNLYDRARSASEKLWRKMESL